jgi:hypothetical protein
VNSGGGGALTLAWGPPGPRSGQGTSTQSHFSMGASRYVPVTGSSLDSIRRSTIRHSRHLFSAPGGGGVDEGGMTAGGAAGAGGGAGALFW